MQPLVSSGRNRASCTSRKGTAAHFLTCTEQGRWIFPLSFEYSLCQRWISPSVILQLCSVPSSAWLLITPVLLDPCKQKGGNAVWQTLWAYVLNQFFVEMLRDRTWHLRQVLTKTRWWYSPSFPCVLTVTTSFFPSVCWAYKYHFDDGDN